ncbi:MAG: permease-like cell division protein FtsX [Betaproteobacteria bacterium]|nr:permease-like cell division protein FtsX [Betaproteobacteria bacterium]
MILSHTSSLIQFNHLIKKTRFNVVFLMLSMALCFSFILTALTLSRYYDNHTKEVLANIHTVIFVNTSTTQKELQALQASINQSPGVLKTELITKESGLAQLKQDNNFTDILSHIHTNPLPDALIVTIKASSVQDLDRLLKSWQSNPTIHKVNIDLPWVERTIQTRDFIHHLLILFTTVMTVLFITLSISSIRHYYLHSNEERYVATCLGTTRTQLIFPMIEIILLESAIVICLGTLASWIILKTLDQGLHNVFYNHLLSNQTLFSGSIVLYTGLVLFIVNSVLTFIIGYTTRINTHSMRYR